MNPPSFKYEAYKSYICLFQIFLFYDFFGEISQKKAV